MLRQTSCEREGRRLTHNVQIVNQAIDVVVLIPVPLKGVEFVLRTDWCESALMYPEMSHAHPSQLLPQSAPTNNHVLLHMRWIMARTGQDSNFFMEIHRSNSST